LGNELYEQRPWSSKETISARKVMDKASFILAGVPPRCVGRTWAGAVAVPELLIEHGLPRS